MTNLLFYFFAISARLGEREWTCKFFEIPIKRITNYPLFLIFFFPNYSLPFTLYFFPYPNYLLQITTFSPFFTFSLTPFP